MKFIFDATKNTDICISFFYVLHHVDNHEDTHEVDGAKKVNLFYFFFWSFHLECIKGSYKSTKRNTKCLHCPANSASNADRTGCTCNSGLYKLTDHGEAPCKGNIWWLKSAY